MNEQVRPELDSGKRQSDTNNVDQRAREVSNSLQRVNRLGAVTERFFSRLYGGLSRRSRLQLEIEKVQRMSERNQQIKQQLRKREIDVERLGGILAAIDEGIIMQDNEGRIVYMNRAAKTLLGSQKAFWETELGTLFDAYRDVTSLDTELAPLGEPTRIQANNRILGAQLAAVAAEDGARLGTMIVLRDVTRDALGDRLKNQFVTGISHELKTPMMVIKTASELLAGAPEDKPADRRWLEKLSRNVDILDRMVVELLDISEMGAGTFTIRRDPINIESMLVTVINGVEPELKRAGLHVSFMARDLKQLAITGDDQRLRWAFGHILQNAIRYTERDGHIIVMVNVENENQIAVRIADTGVGISEKDLPHIFERFYRGEARSRGGVLLDPRGLGQGLFVARTVIEAHGGYVRVESKQHEGSIFTVVLPAA